VPDAPTSLAGLRKEMRREFDHVQTALGDVLRDLDNIKRCLGVIMKLSRHLHGDMASRKVRRRGVR